MTPSEPYSAWTALMFPACGVAVGVYRQVPEAWVFAVTMTALGLATMAFHWLDKDGWEQRADHAAMNGNYMALTAAAMAFPWTGMAAAAGFGAFGVELLTDLPNRSLMGGTVFLTTGAAVYGGDPALGLVGFTLIAAGFGAWQIREPVEAFGRTITRDMAHGLGWHQLVAGGTALLYVGATG